MMGFSKGESSVGAGIASLKNPQKHRLNNGKNSTKAGEAAKQKLSDVWVYLGYVRVCHLPWSAGLWSLFLMEISCDAA